MDIFFLDLSKVNEIYLESHLVTEEKKEYISKINPRQRKIQVFYSDVFIKYLMLKKYNLGISEIKIFQDPFGKPYLYQGQYQFNISHSGKYLICGISKNPVGIDIEQMKSENVIRSKDIFWESEYQDIFLTIEKEREIRFFKYWTLKESYLKWLGTGLSESLKSIEFLNIDSRFIKYRLDKKFNESTPSFYSIIFDSDYVLSICGDFMNEKKIRIYEVDKFELNSFFQ
ncbi:4'-phosphopantetheinyl transferase superfamily protein [Enterococcus hulanensis]|uniref:4'-phosphopantetheinyl transferase family protein n=1 Tax=Enterococcus hulanensis TaxID=2559929 RepID=UPI00288FBA8E|nr:4'-phosphopantetheinyl transferase superfamily protein [Enterococcus hulanensis]MDT2660514.1 4'-phosphopantetheinyl transferase superfamily protein [Enterococcus hulanensis]